MKLAPLVLVALAGAAAGALAPPAALATHDPACPVPHPAGYPIIVTVGAGSAAAYLAFDWDAYHEMPALLPWVYLEANGLAGLQRGGASWFGDADPCQESANPDELVF